MSMRGVLKRSLASTADGAGEPSLGGAAAKRARTGKGIAGARALKGKLAPGKGGATLTIPRVELAEEQEEEEEEEDNFDDDDSGSEEEVAVPAVGKPDAGGDAAGMKLMPLKKRFAATAGDEAARPEVPVAAATSSSSGSSAAAAAAPTTALLGASAGVGLVGAGDDDDDIDLDEEISDFTDGLDDELMGGEGACVCISTPAATVAATVAALPIYEL